MGGYVLSDLALDDLAAIRHYIAADNPAAAQRVVARFFHLFEMLARNPELGMERADFPANLRMHSVGSYVIVYKTTANDIEVSRILHGARDIDALLG